MVSNDREDSEEDKIEKMKAKIHQWVWTNPWNYHRKFSSGIDYSQDYEAQGKDCSKRNSGFD